jgi:hypothetical protein
MLMMSLALQRDLKERSAVFQALNLYAEKNNVVSNRMNMFTMDLTYKFHGLLHSSFSLLHDFQHQSSQRPN